MVLCLLSWFWVLCSAFIAVGYVLDLYPSIIPVWSSLLRWGKLRIGYVNPNRNFYEVPKRWYQHFYIIGVVVNSLLLGIVCRAVFLGQPLPASLTSLLQWLQFPVSHTGEADAIPALLVLTLEQLQVIRRCYETFCINVFSERATMTMLHYLLGIIFYMSIGLTVLAGTDYMELHHTKPVSCIEALLYVAAVVMFVVASVYQNHSFRILRDLRLNNKKDIPQFAGYVMPRGGLFDYVACPHFLSEIVVYVSLNLVYGFQHQVLLALGLFVLTNQVVASLVTFEWYCRNFPGYGKERRAVFPYLL